ncbi:hypothetical protein [Nocardia sp. NPDC051570]|uniref:hypothetical protein n=1 Tax=Nocardia sp. NPDC051570 TaxID=3364324 RepID=UPI003789170E
MAVTLGDSGAEDQNAQVYFFDQQVGDTSAPPTSDVVIGGGPQNSNGNTARVIWYPTTTGTHYIFAEERTPTGKLIGGTNKYLMTVQVDHLPQSSGPDVCEPSGGSLTDDGRVTLSEQVHHPNVTYTLSASTASLPADSIVRFKDNFNTDIGQATVANGVATLQYTPTTLGFHGITGLYFPGGTGDGLLVGQVRMEVTNPFEPCDHRHDGGSARMR